MRQKSHIVTSQSSLSPMLRLILLSVALLPVLLTGCVTTQDSMVTRILISRIEALEKKLEEKPFKELAPLPNFEMDAPPIGFDRNSGFSDEEREEVLIELLIEHYKKTKQQPKAEG